MPRDDLYLVELVEAARQVLRYLDGVSAERWASDSMVRDAVLHQLMIVGEAAGALPDDLRARYPEIPWARMKAFRNVAVHEYFAIEWSWVWLIAHDEVPDLERRARAALKTEFPDLAKRFDA
jgi:uncharacterized protein with HEPN domain